MFRFIYWKNIFNWKNNFLMFSKKEAINESVQMWKFYYFP